MLSIPANGLAFGVDATRRERFSLRQARYHALGETVAQLAGEAKREGRRLKLLDIGLQDGKSRRYIEVHPDCDVFDYSGADLELQEDIYRRDELTERVTTALMEASRRDVPVRLCVDAVGARCRGEAAVASARSD